MTAVILTFHVLIVLALIGVVLMQRSEGGALGMGGAGGGGGFMTGRGAANALTRTTSILAALFFATSLGLAILAGAGEDAEDVIEDLTVTDDGAVISDDNGVPSTEDLLNSLGGDNAASGADGPAIPTEEDLLDALGSDAADSGADAPATDEPAPAATDDTAAEDADPNQ